MFRDRADAGRQLVSRLQEFRGSGALVLALPRGGVVIGREVADGLDAELDILVVRKIGAPHQSELAIGALVLSDPPQVVWNESLLSALHIDESYLKGEYEAQLEEARRRETVYRGGKPPPRICGRPVIVVDDGIATGATAKAALRALARLRPKQLVLAVPVAPPDTLSALADEVDEVACLTAPEDFHAVGQFYRDFSPVSDEEVVGLLKPGAPRKRRSD